MARRNDRDMRKRRLYYVIMGLLVCMSIHAQEDVQLRKLTEQVVQLQKAKASKNALNKTVIDLSASGCPKITLMDEIKKNDNEYRDNGANKFKMNQVVTHVYGRQNTGMVSKGDYFHSTEKDIYYSAIEKTVKKGCTVTYTLTGHVGVQEFVFVSFNPNSNYKAEVNGQSATVKGGGVQHVKIGKVKKEDTITFSITNKSSGNESFVIINYNPQK